MKKQVIKHIKEIESKISQLKKEIKTRTDHLAHIKKQIKSEVDQMKILKEERDQLNAFVREKKAEIPDLDSVRQFVQISERIDQLEMTLQTKVLKPAEERSLVKQISTLAEQRKNLLVEHPDLENAAQLLKESQAQIKETAKNANLKHKEIKQCYLRIKDLDAELKRTRIQVKVEQELLKELRRILKSKRQDLDTIKSIEEIVEKFGEEEISVTDILKQNLKITMEDFYAIQKKIGSTDQEPSGETEGDQ